MGKVERLEELTNQTHYWEDEDISFVASTLVELLAIVRAAQSAKNGCWGDEILLDRLSEALAALEGGA